MANFNQCEKMLDDVDAFLEAVAMASASASEQTSSTERNIGCVAKPAGNLVTAECLRVVYANDVQGGVHV